MALAKISEFTLFALTHSPDDILKKLQSLKIVQIKDVSEGKNHFTGETDKINSEIRLIQDALKISEKYPTLKEASGKHRDSIAQSIIEADKKLSMLKAQNADAEKEIKDIIPFKGSDYPVNKIITDYTTACHGYFAEDVPEIDENTFIQVLSKSNGKTYVWLLARNHSGAPPGFVEFAKSSPLTPKKLIQKHKDDIEKTNIEIKELEAELSELCSQKGLLKTGRLFRKKELSEEKQKLMRTENVLVISGYIVSKNIKLMKKEFPDSFIHFSDAGADAPVAFANNPFVSPVEGITESYTMPSSHDIDPNPIMAIFYYLFFGMMFSDAGYGLLMILVCGFGGFLKKSKISKMLRMFFFCGISTFFWGLMYGSFFGNAITSIGEIFFGRTLILRPLWINPTQEPLTLLILSIALGFLQIITGLCIKLFIQIKNEKIKEGIFDTGSWIVTLSGLGILSAGIAYPLLLTPGIFIASAGAIMLILTQGRDKKNLFLKVSGGILSLYNITSYISDILSYSRLMALGLATGVIAEVVNILGGLGGDSAVGIIMYILIFIVGHGLNFAINMLGAYVHTNRLQYVEFYSKFYEGGGRAFIPFGSRY